MNNLTLADLKKVNKPNHFDLNKLRHKKENETSIPSLSLDVTQKINPRLLNQTKYFSNFKDPKNSLEEMMKNKPKCADCNNNDNKPGALKYLKK